MPPDTGVADVGILAARRESNALFTTFCKHNHTHNTCLFGATSYTTLGRRSCRLRTVRHRKSIRGHSNGSRLVVVTVHLGLHAGSGTEVVRFTVGRVCEVDVQVVGVNAEVIQRVELPSKVVIQENCGNYEVSADKFSIFSVVYARGLASGIVRLNRVHDDEGRSLAWALSLGRVENLAFVLSCSFMQHLVSHPCSSGYLRWFQLLHMLTIRVRDLRIRRNLCYFDFAHRIPRILDGICLLERNLEDGG